GGPQCRRGAHRGRTGRRPTRGDGNSGACDRQRRRARHARPLHRDESAARCGGGGDGMTDFLEQVMAERRADATKAEGAAFEIDLRKGKDNVWTRAKSEGRGDAFTAALRARRAEGHLAVIAEVKRVSPAFGVIAASVDPALQARGYAAAGATAISVLT